MDMYVYVHGRWEILLLCPSGQEEDRCFLLCLHGLYSGGIYIYTDMMFWERCVLPKWKFRRLEKESEEEGKEESHLKMK